MLRLESISKTFSPGTNREQRVLKGLSLEIEKGEFATLLGSNGSGKSTLLRIVTGELEPDAGEVTLDGIRLTGLPAYKRAKYLFRISQSREQNLASILTVKEAFTLAMSGAAPLLKILSTSKTEREIKAALATVKTGLEDRMDDQIWSLSGGEHQLVTVLVAAEMIRSNRSPSNVLLLDEHVAHLDPNSSKMVMTLTCELVERYALTALMVTHDIQIASQYGSRVLVLRDGLLTFDSKAAPKRPRKAEDLLHLLS